MGAESCNQLIIALLHLFYEEPAELCSLHLRKVLAQHLLFLTQHRQQQFFVITITCIKATSSTFSLSQAQPSLSKYDYLYYQQQMRRRTNSLSVKVRALQSIKKISQDCYDLTSPALTTSCKPLLCQAELFNRTTHQLEDSPAFNHRSAPVAHTSRSIQTDRRLVSAFQIGSPLIKTDNSIETEHFCRRVYTTKLIETQAKENSRQKSIFIKKLTKAVAGEVLNATGYELGPLGVRQICDYLLKNRIQDLILDRNNFRDEGVLEIAKVVSRLRLRTLSLASVNMTEKGCKALLAQLTTMETLDELNICSYQGFSRNKLHKDAFEGIAHLLGAGSGKTNLKILKCRGVGLDDLNFKLLCQGLGRGSRMEHLSIEDNEISSHGMAEFKEHAVKIHLKYFDCSGNKIDGGGLLELSYLIGTDYNLTKISKALKTLKINKGKVRSGPLSVFSKSMINNQTLEDLSLDGNPLGEGGKFNVFSSFMSRNWNIKRLSLCQSLHTTDQVMMLCESLQTNRGLEVLILSRNNLEFCAFKKLLDMLSRNKSIKKIHVQACGIVDSFITKAEESMIQLKYLEQIYLDHNYLNDNAGRVLEKCIFKNKMLSKVQLHKNSIGIKMQKQIDQALSYNIENKKFDGPDLSYYRYVEEIQSQQKSSLHQAIQQLKAKENQLNCRQLLHNIAKKEQQSNKKATEIKKEAVEVQKIVEMQSNLKKINELEKKAEMNRINDSLVNDSKVSFGEFEVHGVGRGVSIELENSSFVSEVSENLSQTH